MDGGRAGRPVRAQHRRRALVEPPDADRARSHGPQLRVAHRRYHPGIPDWLADQEWNPQIGLDRRRWDIHGVYVPEAELDIEAEASRLRTTMDDIGCVNLFISEGAGVESIVAELEAAGADIPRDPFGHVMLDKVNPGAWFGKQFAERLGAEKVMIQADTSAARRPPTRRTSN